MEEQKRGEVLKDDENLNYEVFRLTSGRVVMLKEAQKAFDRVANRKNWKNRIRATVRIWNEEELELIRRAVMFYTGSVLQANGTVGDMMTLEADGYYLTIGA